jgi:hypothetical protein
MTMTAHSTETIYEPAKLKTNRKASLLITQTTV